MSSVMEIIYWRLRPLATGYRRAHRRSRRPAGVDQPTDSVDAGISASGV